MEEVYVTANQRIEANRAQAQMEAAAAAARAQAQYSLQLAYQAMMAAQAQQQATDAQQAEKQKEQQKSACAQKRAAINGNKAGCLSFAGQRKAADVRSCPIETEVSTGLNVNAIIVGGSITVTTQPNSTCVNRVQVVFESSVLDCNATAIKAESILPAYCY